MAIGSVRVRRGARVMIPYTQLNSQSNVKNGEHQQPDTDGPQEDGHVSEKGRIPIDGMWSFENLKIAEHVQGDETDEAKACQGDNDFLANRGLKVANKAYHPWGIIH